MPSRLTLAAFLLLLTTAAPAQTLARRGWAGSGITVEPWYHQPIVYTVDPLAFQDSGTDGFGDLRGLTLRLPYLQSLAVDALLLSPLTLQPNPANPIEPAYGSEDDFGRLVADASRLKIRILVDLPLTLPGTDPTAADPAAQLLGTARFWLTRGVAGLRLTFPPGANLFGESRQTIVAQLRRVLAGYPGERVLLTDSEPAPAPTAFRVAHERSSRRRAQNDRAQSGELQSNHRPQTRAQSPATALRIDRTLASLTTLTPANLAEALTRAAAAPDALLASDSDLTPRSFGRYGEAAEHPEAAEGLARILATVLFTARAGVQLQFGQELGMTSPPAGSGNVSYPAGAPELTPMQWGAFPLPPEADAAASTQPAEPLAEAFSAGTPWLAFGPSEAVANVALEDPDRDSLLNWYRTLAALHGSLPALRSGTFQIVPTGTPGLLAYLRRPQHEAATQNQTGKEAAAAPVLVLLNLTAHPVLASPAAALARLGLQTTLARTLLRSGGAATHELNQEIAAPVPTAAIPLAPYGTFLGELRLQPGLETLPQLTLPRHHH